MSRFYQMSVEISGHDPARTSQIRAAAEEQWPFDDWWPSADEDQGKPNASVGARHFATAKPKSGLSNG